MNIFIKDTYYKKYYPYYTLNNIFIKTFLKIYYIKF